MHTFLTLASLRLFGTAVPQTREIVYRGGLVTFEIPATWVEESDPDGTPIFFGAGADAGTLRLSVTTFKSVDIIGEVDAAELLRKTPAIGARSVERLSGGNAIAVAETHGVEDGVAITLYWWYLANPVPPRHMRLAAFSFTVPSKAAATSDNVRDVHNLSLLLRNVQFAPELGE